MASLSWCRAPIWSPWPDFCFLSDNWVPYVGHPLWREAGSVIYLYNCFWILPEQKVKAKVMLWLTVSQSVSQYVLVSNSLWNLWADIIFCLKVAVLSLWGALSHERSGLSPARAKSKSKSHYDQQSVGESVLMSGAHLRPVTNFSFSLRLSFRKLLFVIFVALSLTRGRVCNLL
jgi:hypothetical protein